MVVFYFEPKLFSLALKVFINLTASYFMSYFRKNICFLPSCPSALPWPDAHLALGVGRCAEGSQKGEHPLATSEAVPHEEAVVR